jgi:hypothetical protein
MRLRAQGRVPNQHCVGARPDEAHEPLIRLIEVGDVASSGMTGLAERDASIARRRKVYEHVRAGLLGRNVPIAPVDSLPLLGKREAIVNLLREQKLESPPWTLGIPHCSGARAHRRSSHKIAVPPAVK